MSAARAVPLLVSCLAVAAACGGGASATATGGGPRTELRIELHPNGVDAGPVVRATLRCGPPGGSHPHAAAACAALAGSQHPFAPLPRGIACSMIYGGPQVAFVTGSYRGGAVRARFSRGDGCQTTRWTRVAALLDLGG